MTSILNSARERSRSITTEGYWHRVLLVLLIGGLWGTAMPSRCLAQGVVYSQGYPVTSYPANSYPASSYPASSYPSDSYPVVSYPANSYPVSSSVISSQPVSSYPIGQPVVTQHSSQHHVTGQAVSSMPVVRSRSKDATAVTTFPKNLSSTSTLNSSFKSKSRRRSVHPFRSPSSASNDSSTRLASTRTYRSDSPFRQLSSLDSTRPFDEPNLIYSRDRIDAARNSAAQFERIAQSATPVVAEIARENAGFAEHWANLAESYAGLESRVTGASSKLHATTQDFDQVNTKLSHYGLTPTIGLLLRHKKEQLDAWQVQDSHIHFASDELKRSRQRQLELEMVRFDGARPNEQANQFLAESGYDLARSPNQELVTQIERLFFQRSKWLESIGQGYQDYQQKLGELDSATTASAELTSDYRSLINRHITWIRSGDAVSVRDLRNFGGGFSALFDSRRSADFGPTLERKLQSNSIGGIALLAWIVLIAIIRWRAKSWLIGIGNRNRMRDATPESKTIAAGMLTILVAVAFPAILYAIGRWLGTGIVSEATLHSSSGFFAASLVALGVEVPRQLLRNHGYLDKHVVVDMPRRSRASKYLSLFGFGLIVAAYTVTVMGAIDHGMWRGSVSRFGFMFAMLVLAWTAHLALRPTGGSLEPLIAKFGGRVIHRIRFLIYMAGIGFPIGLMILSGLGYGFTANVLLTRSIITLTSLTVAWTLWAGIKILSARGWQMLTGAAPPPRQFDEYGEIPQKPGAGDAGVLGEHFLELKHHLAFLSQCALVLGAIVCFGWLWIDVFPNVRMGNPVVWNAQETVTETSIDAAGQTVSSTLEQARPVTALHLLMAAATLFVAFQLAKLLPALFDALVLQRVSFDEGMEHFSLVLGRCLLFGIGCFIACQWIGVRWQAIQWLAVGLTIGLGFGLQDMVRNLFGGLIVLFEKPARLGDLITVGKVTGRVASQKLRTTVLSDDDGRELIVPNKNFVSEDVVNWMGAGRLSVIPIEVAVTRDERPADICRTLYELVIDQKDVLLTPVPQATLVCVGKRSQRIEVRAWIEEGQDAARYRESLLSLVRKFLREKKMLMQDQPTQPAIPTPGTKDRSSRSDGRRRRSA